MNNINYLKAVFWDYPDFINPEKIKLLISQNNNIKPWLLTRFLEHGRAIDTLEYFNVNEIKILLKDLRLRDFTRKKWNRLVEVYGSEGK